MYKLRSYVAANGKDIFTTWQDGLRDQRARLARRRRLNRVMAGNLGDNKFCGNGVWELRVDVGTGYRVYYAMDEDRAILLLGGGSKSSQSADINRAVERYEEWKRRGK